MKEFQGVISLVLLFEASLIPVNSLKSIGIMSSQLFIAVTECLQKHYKGGKIYFGSRLQRSQSVVSRLHCFQSVEKEKRHGGRVCHRCYGNQEAEKKESEVCQ